MSPFVNAVTAGDLPGRAEAQPPRRFLSALHAAVKA
jgi:hypothetical protein